MLLSTHSYICVGNTSCQNVIFYVFYTFVFFVVQPASDYIKKVFTICDKIKIYFFIVNIVRKQFYDDRCTALIRI